MENYENSENEETNLIEDIAKDVALGLAAVAAGYALLAGIGFVAVGVKSLKEKRKQAQTDKEFKSLISANY